MNARVNSKAHIVKPNFFVTISLLICMVFATSASAFLHLHEHNLELSHADLTHVEHQSDTDAHHDHDVSTEHAHHFNLHITADLVEHDAISFIKSTDLISSDMMTPLVSRSYTPPIPPPNA
jgi:hypothetical protein